ncbi:hypothetical protein GCM10028801_23090 [Nocardioides maradonensis]
MSVTTDTTPRRPRGDRTEAMQLAADEYLRFADTLAALRPEDWSRPTACPEWDVRQMACHTVGMAAMASGMRETMRQQRIANRDAARNGGTPLDALTALQVRERADWTPAQVIAGMRAVAPRAAAGRRRVPGFVRARRLPDSFEINGRLETWRIGFLIDTILTRDPWMHRMDIADAVGREPTLAPEHDGRIVAGVVAEWADRHGQPFRLELTGPAGGIWSSGSGGPAIEMDAIEFCRILSGRGSGEGLLETQVPF